jgi:hypothetical protein
MELRGDCGTNRYEGVQAGYGGLDEFGSAGLRGSGVNGIWLAHCVWSIAGGIPVDATAGDARCD